MKRILFIAIFLFVPTLFANADTHIPAGSITQDTLWTASSSPYILDGSVDISYGYTLTIGPGVTIDTSITGQSAPVLSMFKGILIMNGTQDNPITVKGLASIRLAQSSTTISHVNFLNMEQSGGSNLDLEYTQARIGYSSFKGSQQGLHIFSGDTIIATSSIDGYSSGLYFRKQAIFLMRNQPVKSQPILERFLSTAIRSVMNAVVKTVVHTANASTYVPSFNQGVLTITNSSFLDTNSLAIDNDYVDPSLNPTSMISAVNNWWGRPNDPSAKLVRFSNPLNYTPWLDHEPDLTEKSKVVCCSSVLFIPGIESSRLYSDGNTLWEPHRNDNVRALFLNDNGSSSDPEIYSGGPIDSAWGYSIYSSFMKFLNGLVAQGSMNEWSPFGYDWRKSISDIVLGNEMKATTTESLIDTVSRLAKNSKTGKVTIIAHSNGGLVAKYLVKTLADQGRSDLIDSVISVAVPFLGTPEAIGGILHGDDESLAWGLILKTSVARQLGQNMASAYSLLPSASYFNQNPGTVIDFSSTTPTSINDGSYPQSISTGSGLSDFIVDAKNMNVRVGSSSSDISNPIKGNVSLMASAGNLHSILDTFSWPASIANWAIVGWNALTTKSLTYGGENKCGFYLFGWSCKTVAQHEENMTNMGDGTVVSKSASYGASAIASIDLNQTDKGKIAHGNILESSTTQAIVRNIIKENSIASIPGVTIGEPDYSKESNYIEVSTYSNVQPHVYDTQGRHTGEIVAPIDTDSLYKAYENNIPGSSIDITANTDTDYNTHIYIPDDGQKYAINLNGTGLGGFNLDVDRVGSGKVINHAEYSGLPATPMTFASTSIQFTPYSSGSGSGGGSGNGATFAASLPVLAIDTDGDGKTDMNAVADATSTVTTDSYLDLLKNLCTDISKSHQPTVVGRIITYPVIIDCKSIGTRIDNIKTLLDSGKLTQVHDYSDQLSAYIKHRDLKTMTDADNKELWKMLSLFLSQYE